MGPYDDVASDCISRAVRRLRTLHAAKAPQRFTVLRHIVSVNEKLVESDPYVWGQYARLCLHDIALEMALEIETYPGSWEKAADPEETSISATVRLVQIPCYSDVLVILNMLLCRTLFTGF